MAGYRLEASNAGSSATVGTSSGQVMAANPGALERTIVNDSANIVYLRLGTGNAVVGSGIRLNASGGAWTSTVYRGAVQAIASGAGSNVCLSEV